MGDYITVDNVESMVQGLVIGTDGALTTEDAEFIISLVEGEVNGVLNAMGVSTPVGSSASPQSYKFIRALVSQGVVGFIQADIHALSDDTEGSREGAFLRRYERGIDALENKGGAYLADAVSLTGDLIRNVPAALGAQLQNVDLYSRLSTLTRSRFITNERAVSRYYRNRGFWFEGGLGV